VLLLALNLVGLVGLVAGTYAFIRNRRDARRNSRARLRIAILGLGALLAAASAAIIYPLDDHTQIVGLPFTAAAFEDGADFVGPFTIPAFIANATFWFLLPQLVLWQILARERQP
jgi:hypothetical protein